ncbi:protein kinase domain-containing protein [Nocardia sp. NBC_00403]|uniref:protein kinase domain-containing protein n=1 Tax=Nocardia sp. NBC_00403 TaxID=2975990 RepID=UPI002E1AC264
MSDDGIGGTQRDLRFGIVAELAEAGFDAAREVGRGGFGVVYQCIEQALDRTVAVKVLSTEVDDDGRARFLREQRALGRFSGHPNIVQVLRADITATGRPFIVMPFHRRGSLDTRIRADGPIPWQEVLSIGVKLAGALASAHACGVVHRDVNPANVLVTDYGEPQLADFGIARIGGLFETATGLVAGTPAYTAPEVLKGAAPSVASDVYGLGATLFCLLTGHAAFARRTGESMVAQFVRITSDPVPDLRAQGVPPLLHAAIDSAMAPEPTDRPASAQDFGEQLRNIQFACGLPVDTPAVPIDVETMPSVTAQAVARTPPATPTAVATPMTRYRPRTSRHRLVERPALLELLRAGQSRRLVLIHAPAGFGKSTLATQWADVLEADGSSVAWLTVDTDDDNVVWFLSHLVEAVRRVRPALAAELAQILEERASNATRHVMTMLINQIHAGGETVAVVIEDWHLVTSPASIAAMEFLLDNGCHHLRMIVTSRNRTGLPLGRMRVQDELVEIDESQLRFDAADTARLLAGVEGVELDADEVDNLCRSTEGWAAALQLAALSLRGKDRPGSHLDGISGQHYAIGEYLMENVVADLDPPVLDFLMRTAVTATICGDLAEALAEVSSGQQMLEDLYKQDLFLRSVDDELRWFRYHGLFADYLRRRLIRQHPGLLEQLHATAAIWFAEHDMLTEAVDHALAADAPERAMSLIEEHADELIENAMMATFLGLVAKLPTALCLGNPRLQLSVAWATIALQRAAATRTALEQVDAAIAALPADDALGGDLRAEAAVARAAELMVIDRCTDLPDYVTASVQAPVRPFFANALATTAAAIALCHFDFDGAARWHEWAEPSRTRSTGPFNAVYGHCIAGLAAFDHLDIADAETSFRTAVRLALETGTQSHATRQSTALLGDLLYETGQFVEAQELLTPWPGMEGGTVEVLLAIYGTGARLAALRGDLDTARARLDEGQHIAELRSLPRVAARILNERVRHGLPIPQTDREKLEHLPTYRRQPDAILALTAELEQDAAVHLLLAENSTDSIRAATARAERLVQVIQRQTRPRALLHAQLRYVCCLSAAGQSDQAATLLAPLLRRCAELGLVRTVVDSGPAIAPVLETLAEATDEKMRPPHLFLRQVSAAIDQSHRV